MVSRQRDVFRRFTEHESGKGADALDRRPKLAEAIKAAKKARGPVARCHLSVGRKLRTLSISLIVLILADVFASVRPDVPCPSLICFRPATCTCLVH